MSDEPNPVQNRAPASASKPAMPTIDVQALLGGSTEARLMHAGVEYRLRITKQGKLLLTK